MARLWKVLAEIPSVVLMLSSSQDFYGYC